MPCPPPGRLTPSSNRHRWQRSRSSISTGGSPRSSTAMPPSDSRWASCATDGSPTSWDTDSRTSNRPRRSPGTPSSGSRRHEDPHRRRRHAALGGGAGRPRCAGQRLPACLPAHPGRGRLRPATLRHLLTHTAGIPELLRASDLFRPDWGDSVALDDRCRRWPSLRRRHPPPRRARDDLHVQQPWVRRDPARSSRT